jgi:hypothetical protein
MDDETPEVPVLELLDEIVRDMKVIHNVGKLYTLTDKEYRRMLEIYHLLGKIRLDYLSKGNMDVDKRN